MPKIRKRNLARGSKLSSQHIEDNLGPIQDLFVEEKLNRDNLQEIKVPFYVNFTFPSFKQGMFGLTDEDKQSEIDGSLVFPLPLIPTQDHFSVVGRLTTDTPIYLLDSISISMDLRGEGCSTPPPQAVFPFTPQSKSWKINYETASEQDIQLTLFQKDYKVLSNKNITPTNSIFTTTIPATIAFAGSESRVENPYYIFGINKQINPYKSYYLGFHFPNQPDGTTINSWVVNDLVISFKFYTILDTRYEEQDNTTNKPQANANSEITNYNLDLIAPTPYSVISAENANSGLQTNLNRIDEAVEEKLTTGVDKFGQLGAFEYESFAVPANATSQAIETCAVYDVLVVPFWQGTIGGSGAITTFYNFDSFGVGSDVLQGAISPSYYDPDGESGSPQNSYNGVIQDIRTIPLFYPFTIHHVLAWHNEQIKELNGINYDEFGQGTTTGTITGKIGVGLGTCFQADHYSYDEIAFLEYGSSFNNVVDQITLQANKYNRDGILGSNVKRSGTLMQVPLTFGVEDGLGFYSQSVPYYCGGGTKRFEGRSGVPDTLGMENFIEIRWQFSSGGRGWFDNATLPNTNPQTIAGIGGHFVYLVGKKLLTTNRNNLQE